MAGAYRMALSRAQVVIANPKGEQVEVLRNMTVSVRDGVARARAGAGQVQEMQVSDLDRDGRRSYTITGEDGSTWTVTKPCNCGGGR